MFPTGSTSVCGLSAASQRASDSIVRAVMGSCSSKAERDVQLVGIKSGPTPAAAAQEVPPVSSRREDAALSGARRFLKRLREAQDKGAASTPAAAAQEVPPASSRREDAALSGARRLFLSYRVSTDADLVERVYDKLRSLGVAVWWDRKCLLPGQPWEDGFADGLLASDVFVPFLSKAALAPFASLQADSQCDNVLLEYRLALELKARGQIDSIFPVFVGEPVVSDVLGDGFADFFERGGLPQAPEVSVASVDAKFRGHLERCGEVEHDASSSDAHSTVKQTLRGITEFQGHFLRGSPRRDVVEGLIAALAKIASVPESFLDTPDDSFKSTASLKSSTSVMPGSASPDGSFSIMASPKGGWSSSAVVPPDVPVLPTALQARPELIDELKQRVLSGTAIAPKMAVVPTTAKRGPTIAAHGMGGVGKGCPLC